MMAVGNYLMASMAFTIVNYSNLDFSFKADQPNEQINFTMDLNFEVN